MAKIYFEKQRDHMGRVNYSLEVQGVPILG